MKQYQAVIFDLDGTLLDTLDDLHKSMNVILQKRNLPSRTKEEAASFLGNGSVYYLEQSCAGKLHGQAFADALSEYKAYYQAHMHEETKPYMGMLSLLENLQSKGLKTAVVSNKFDDAVKGLCAKYFGNRLHIAIGEGHGLRPKPAGDMLLAVAKTLGLSLQECVYVGDTEVDIQTAREAGMDCISVTWGFRSKAQLLQSGATVLADTKEELQNYIFNQK